MKKVLVTGADGFIGSHLTEMLLAQGYRVKALAYYNSFNNWGWLDGVKHPHFCKHITQDVKIRDGWNVLPMMSMTSITKRCIKDNLKLWIIINNGVL